MRLLGDKMEDLEKRVEALEDRVSILRTIAQLIIIPEILGIAAGIGTFFRGEDPAVCFNNYFLTKTALMGGLASVYGVLYATIRC